MAHASIGELGEQVAQEGTQNCEFEQSIIAPLTTQTLTQAPEKICINCATINLVTGHMEDGGSDGGGGGNGGDSDDGGWRRKHPSCRNARAAKHTYSHLNARKGTNNICRRSWKSWGFPNSVEIICTAKQKAQNYAKSIWEVTLLPHLHPSPSGEQMDNPHEQLAEKWSHSNGSGWIWWLAMVGSSPFFCVTIHWHNGGRTCVAYAQRERPMHGQSKSRWVCNQVQKTRMVGRIQYSDGFQPGPGPIHKQSFLSTVWNSVQPW